MFHFEELNVLAENASVPEVYNQTYVGVNPATVGIWHNIKNSEPWRLQLATVYGVVVDGLGKSLVDNIAYEIMWTQNFQDAEGVKAALWPDDLDISVDIDHVKKIFKDKHYGLKK